MPDDDQVGIVYGFMIDFVVETGLRIYFLVLIWAYCKEGQAELKDKVATESSVVVIYQP